MAYTHTSDDRVSDPNVRKPCFSSMGSDVVGTGAEVEIRLRSLQTILLMGCRAHECSFVRLTTRFHLFHLR